jgi:hypothetical protein
MFIGHSKPWPHEPAALVARAIKSFLFAIEIETTGAE